MTKKIAVVNFFKDGSQHDKDTRGYHFFTLIDDLEHDDIVAVRTVNGLRFAAFDKYLKASTHAKSYIIAKVDENEIEETLEKEAEVKQIERQLEDRMREVKRMEEYKAVAANDDEMKTLLAKLDELK